MDPDLPAILETTNNYIWGMPHYVCWIIIVALLLVSALFSASENAFTNCNRYHFQTLADKGSLNAKLVIRLVKNFDNTLVTVLVGNNIAQTVTTFLSALLFYNLCQAWGVPDGLEAVLSTVVMSFLIYILADTFPKILSKSLPNRMASILAFPVFIVSIPLYPIILFFRGLLFLAHKIFKVKDQDLLTKEELIESTKNAINDEEVSDDEDEESEPLFEKNETEIIDNVFNFDKEKVAKVYTPLDKAFVIDGENLSIDELNALIIKSDYSRIPIYEGSKDNVVGILVLKIYFEEYAKDQHLDFRSILEEPVKIDINMPLDDAFAKLNNALVHLGLVTKDDKVIGIVSMEDLLEELVDNIDEAHGLPKKSAPKGGRI